MNVEHTPAYTHTIFKPYNTELDVFNDWTCCMKTFLFLLTHNMNRLLSGASHDDECLKIDSN